MSESVLSRLRPTPFWNRRITVISFTRNKTNWSPILCKGSTVRKCDMLLIIRKKNETGLRNKSLANTIRIQNWSVKKRHFDLTHQYRTLFRRTSVQRADVKFFSQPPSSKHARHQLFVLAIEQCRFQLYPIVLLWASNLLWSLREEFFWAFFWVQIRKLLKNWDACEDAFSLRESNCTIEVKLVLNVILNCIVGFDLVQLRYSLSIGSLSSDNDKIRWLFES